MKIDLDRASRMTLVEQLVLKLKTDIIHGKYKVGERLPGIHELSEAAQVSEKVPRRALAQLATLGWTVPRRGVGSVVADRGCDVAVKGRVLIYTVDTGYSYYCSSLVATLRSKLVRAGYRLMAIAASVKIEEDGGRQLEEMLKERWNLVLECGYRPVSRSLIEEPGWPFVVLGDGAAPICSTATNCLGAVGISSGKALPEFILACVKARVKSVLQFEYDAGALNVESMLKTAGLSVATVRVPRQRHAENVARCAMHIMEAELRRCRGKLPDLILFTDDYLAQGGLLSLATHGIRIPEDVRVVSLAIKGIGPIWIEPVTRLEMDAFVHGAAIAKAVIDYLRRGRFRTDISLGSVWRRGNTF